MQVGGVRHAVRKHGGRVIHHLVWVLGIKVRSVAAWRPNRRARVIGGGKVGWMRIVRLRHWGAPTPILHLGGWFCCLGVWRRDGGHWRIGRHSLHSLRITGHHVVRWHPRSALLHRHPCRPTHLRVGRMDVLAGRLRHARWGQNVGVTPGCRFPVMELGGDERRARGVVHVARRRCRPLVVRRVRVLWMTGRRNVHEPHTFSLLICRWS
mmetsp:Transcript_30294/g.58232  ORF Transcript_30294/g.58232 Transcript_30294/m.58232 type:complete len:209 (+) Transcript_30294:246-872(+)